MKRKMIQAYALTLTLLMGSSSVFACTTTPKNINTSKPSTQLEASVCTAGQEAQKQTTPAATATEKQPAEEAKADAPKGAFKVDNFVIIQTALQKLGVEPDELETLIKEGKKLPEILEMKNITIKKFKKALLKEYFKVINQGVKDKQITKTQGKMLKEAIEEKVDDWMDYD